MAKSEKDMCHKVYLVELGVCEVSKSLRNMDKLGRPYGKWEDCRIFAFLLTQKHPPSHQSIWSNRVEGTNQWLTIELIFIINVECKKHVKMKAF